MVRRPNFLRSDDVQRRVDAIRAASEDKDNAAAHALEDQLWFDVLREIAESDAFGIEVLAQEAIKSRDIHFTRWVMTEEEDEER